MYIRTLYVLDNEGEQIMAELAFFWINYFLNHTIPHMSSINVIKAVYTENIFI